MATRTRTRTLAELAASQAWDDQAKRLRRRKREVRTIDLHRHRGRVDGPTDGERLMEATPDDGPEPWQLAAIREGAGPDIPPASVLIGFSPTWGERVTHYDPAAGEPCPCCGGVPGPSRLRPHEVCVCCHATRGRPRQWPQQTARAVAATMRWPLRARLKRLRGGLGKTACA